MSHHLLPGRRRASFAVATVAALAIAGVAGSTSYAVSHGSSAASPRVSAQHEARGFYDVGTSSQRAQVQALRTQGRVSKESAVRTFRASAPGQTVLDISGSTGTVRMLTRLDGFLTPASKKTATKIALGYVKNHHAALGLTLADLKTFHLRRDYRDITGTHHLFFIQRIGGKQVIHNGLTAAVNKRGHLLTVGGTPVSKSQVAGVQAAASPRLATPAQALAAARGTTTASADVSQDSATPGLFVTPSGLRLAWQTVVMSSDAPAETVLDAQTGQILMNHPLVTYEASGDSTGRVYRFFPRASHGGKHVKVDFTKHHWLSRHAHILKGNNSHTYSDVDDNQRVSKNEEVHAQKGQSWGYRLKPFHLAFAKSFCSNPWPCSWNPNKPFSWRTNRAQNATQVFYFVNNWHDHLMKKPIGFNAAAGNFQAVNHGKGGKGGDPLTTQTDDGANTDHGLPDGGHIDNANMSTPPDGHKPRMQMYLQHEQHTPYSFNGDPYSPTNVGDEADTVYHEYTHGLSGRLNVDVDGSSTLGGGQAGAMGEAWSDWYAMDYLVHQHLERDRHSKADVRLFRYDGLGVNFDRTEPIDCKVGQMVKLCNGGATGHKGGYTYQDYGKVIGGPEVHGDGEIWAQTLWTLRYQLGSKKSESLVTRAMELAPYNPSFLDMRNAILVADTSVYGGKDRDTIWKVFAKRGMGFFAGSLGGNDPQPGWSFAMPPQHLALQTVQGSVTDSGTGDPLVGVSVTLAFQGSGTANPTALTDGSGHFEIHGLPEGKYTDLSVSGTGFHSVRKNVTVGATGATVNFSVRPDWAASSSGARISSFTGADYSPECGPAGAIDLSQGSGWGSNSGPGRNDAPTAAFKPKHIVIDMHHAVNITGFGVDPSSTCGDQGNASTAGYSIATSPDSSTWTTAATGAFTSADNGQINDVPPDNPGTGTTNVRYVKFTIESNQVPDFATDCPNGGLDGCRFADMSELEVFGTPAV